jgi:hypothetical protein
MRAATIEELSEDVFCAIRAEVLRAGKVYTVYLVLRQSPASKDVHMETEEATTLEAVTRRQPVQI